MRVNGATPTPELKTVRLLQIPLPVYARSTQHFDELMREFALISLDTGRQRPSTDTARPVPLRLLQLVDQLVQDFASFTASQEVARDEALARGEAELDLVYELPIAAAEASRRLGELLEEVDDYCRSGQHLITLATPAESLAFRRWYLDEFIGQLEDDKAPDPWPEYVAQNHPDDDWARG